MLNSDFDVDTIFEDRRLASVLCLQEVCIMWGKSPRQVHWAIDRDQVIARKSFTGGTWLLSYDSVLQFWGEPEKSITEWMV